MKIEIITTIIKRGRKLFANEDTLNKSRNINLHKLVNDYHYNFYSTKNYKTSCIYSTFTCFCLTSTVLSVLIFLYVSIIVKELFYLMPYSILLYIISMIGFGVGVIRNQNIINRQILTSFNKYLSITEKADYKSNVRKISFALKHKELLRNVTLRWLDEKIRRKNYSYIANEISNNFKLLELHSTNKSKPLMSVIYTSDSKSRITSYLIALISLISVIIIQTSDVTVFYEIFSTEAFWLYIKILFLAIEILFIVFLYRCLAIDILTVFQDKFDDILKRDKIPNKNRVNRLINILVLNHIEEIDD